jgi:hypothetical protein
MNGVVRDSIRELIERYLDNDNVKLKVDLMGAEEVIAAHNALKDVDDLLKDRWYALGAPDPELLR